MRPQQPDDAWADEARNASGGWAYALVPLAAGAIAALATTLPGGGRAAGSGGATASGPVRTR
jgi:hypothetical protein